MHVNRDRIPVAIIGATGVVGQTAARLISKETDFYVAELAASPRRAGLRYHQALEGRCSLSLPPEVLDLELKTVESLESRYVISALPTDQALELEPLLLARGHYVFSNASAFRMRADVPILIPELNGAHLQLLDRQVHPGKIVCNSNCVAAVLAPVLAPMRQFGGLVHVSVVTLQAISGAGYPGVSALDICQNTIPHIAGEAEKIECETQKILGSLDHSLEIPMTIHVHRVPVLHGHSVAVHVLFAESVDANAVRVAFQEAAQEQPSLYQLHSSESAPQPRLHLSDDDYCIHIGGIIQGGDPRVIGVRALGHNLVRGAAGAALLNLKAVHARALVTV